jgi:photosystem II stability/assembly factor-like uncharacterized protein
MKIDDVSPTFWTHTNTLPSDIRKTHQSPSGRAQCVAVSQDGTKIYVGGWSGVWVSDDGGETFYHPELSQPDSPFGPVPGALFSPNVYDLLISPTNNNILLAATGREARRPTKAGIYRSEDGAKTWKLVHQFGGDVGRLVVAPDNTQLIFGAGGFAVAKSEDGGNSWVNKMPPLLGDSVWNVVVGPQEGAVRRVYGIGSKVWYSKDNGNSWLSDSGFPAHMAIGPPGDGPGTGSLAVAIHPRNSFVIYISKSFGDEHTELWRGDFSSFDSAGRATWTQLPSIPINYPHVTPSGCSFIVPHISNFDGTLYLIASDCRTAHISLGEPVSTSDWKRIDSNIHLDPHGVGLTPDFEYKSSPSGNFGRIVIVNDGGLYYTLDGTKTWIQVKQLSTLTILNMAILPQTNEKPALCIGTTDNNGFFSFDGGKNWKTQHYLGGDNDWCFSDPLQPSRLIVVAPRDFCIYLYRSSGGNPVPDGTIPGQRIPEAPRIPVGIIPWNLRSNLANIGYRPLILTLPNESPEPDGDFITIYSDGTRTMLLRTFAMSKVTDSKYWVQSSSSGPLVWAIVPDVPDLHVNIVQASGGHHSPVFYVSDATTPTDSKVFLSGPCQERLWRWTSDFQVWGLIVPSNPASNGPSKAKRFFVDPYRPDILYVLDTNHIFRSEDGGTTWNIDSMMETVVNENRAFPFGIGNTTNAQDALIRDMAFDPYNPNSRFAAGPAGVFHTSDGVNWKSLIRTAANPMHPTTLTYDFVSSPYVNNLYVSTSNRGLLRVKLRKSLSLRSIFIDKGIHFPVSIATLAQIFGHPRPISIEEFVLKLVGE